MFSRVYNFRIVVLVGFLVIHLASRLDHSIPFLLLLQSLFGSTWVDLAEAQAALCSRGDPAFGGRRRPRIPPSGGSPCSRITEKAASPGRHATFKLHSDLEAPRSVKTFAEFVLLFGGERRIRQGKSTVADLIQSLARLVVCHVVTREGFDEGENIPIPMLPWSPPPPSQDGAGGIEKGLASVSGRMPFSSEGRL